MRLGVAAATQIAMFICGEGNKPFPYRTGRELTMFFTSLGHPFRTDDYSSRSKMAEEAMIKIDAEAAKDRSDDLSPTLVEIIETLMSPSAFTKFGESEAEENYEQALKAINRVLRPLKLEVVLEDGAPSVQRNDGTVLSTARAAVKSVRKFTFAPGVFTVPESMEVQEDLVSVMIPFGAHFKPVYAAIKLACEEVDLRCKRADDLWKESTFVQDIFELICASSIVVVDFSERNSNVFYEAGIAHTLGKVVVPLVQNIEHIPSDLRQHRAITYHPNSEGLQVMRTALVDRLKTIVDGHDWSDF